MLFLLCDRLLPGCEIDYRLDGRLFNRSHLQAKTKVTMTAVITFSMPMTEHNIFHQPCWSFPVLSDVSIPVVHHWSRTSAMYMQCQHIIQATAQQFYNHKRGKHTEVIVYKVCITILLYEIEARVTYRYHLKILVIFHQGCFRKILYICWANRRTNASILMDASTTNIEAVIMQN